MSRDLAGLSRCRRRPLGGRRRLFTGRLAYCLRWLLPALGRGGLHGGTGRAGPAPPSGGAGSGGRGGFRHPARWCERLCPGRAVGEGGSSGVSGLRRRAGCGRAGLPAEGGGGEGGTDGPGPGGVCYMVCAPRLSLMVVPGAGESCRSAHSLLCAACLRPACSALRQARILTLDFVCSQSLRDTIL